jgi:hypothetical protein
VFRIATLDVAEIPQRAFEHGICEIPSRNAMRIQSIEQWRKSANGTWKSRMRNGTALSGMDPRADAGNRQAEHETSFCGISTPNVGSNRRMRIVICKPQEKIAYAKSKANTRILTGRSVWTLAIGT